jgi:glutaredoxin
MNQIDLYYSSVCGLCTKAIDFFYNRGVTFTAHAIEYDEPLDQFIDSETTREMYRRCEKKVEFVPQIFIDDRYVGGWRNLESMIESHEIDEILYRR